MAADGPLRVLILSQTFHPEPDLKCLPLARHLHAQGHDVQVLTAFPNYPGGVLYPGYHLSPWSREIIDEIPVLRVACYLSHNRNGVQRAMSYLSFAAACFLALPLLKFRPDAIYVYNLVTLVPVASIARTMWGSKVVLDVQDLWPESVTASGMMRNRSVLRVLGSLCDKAYRTVDTIIAQSPGFKAQLVHRDIPARRVQVIYNWSPYELSVPSHSDQIANEDVHVVYAGNVGTVQALDVVVEAAAQCRKILPRVRFTIVGNGTDFERLRTQAHGLPNVTFLGWMPPERLAPILANASALLLHLADDPVFSITIPSKLQQYLQVGRPILCGVAGDASHLVAVAGAGLTFIPGDAADLIRALTELSTMSAEARQTMAARGAEYYETHLARTHGLAAMVRALQADISA